MTREEITVGIRLRVIAPRWDEPIGAVGRVSAMGLLFNNDRWWFTVEWLMCHPKRSPYSLRMWEEDLPTFELVTGPIVLPTPMPQTKQDHAIKAAPTQTALPFTETDDD